MSHILRQKHQKLAVIRVLRDGQGNTSSSTFSIQLKNKKKRKMQKIKIQLDELISHVVWDGMTL